MQHMKSLSHTLADAVCSWFPHELPSPGAGNGALSELYCFDLGTNTGISRLRFGAPLESCTLHLATRQELEAQRRQGKERTLDIRFERFFKLLLKFIRPGVGIVIEDVGFSTSRMQSQLWGSWRSALWAVAVLRPGVRMFCVPVGTLKEFATGDSSAQKLAMAQALAKHRPQDYKLVQGEIEKVDGTIADDNEVDAIWLALYAEAVERGERSFLGVYQRKQLKAAERREKKAQRRLKARLKSAAKAAQIKAKKRAIRTALRSLGTCCGVFRKHVRHQAVCRKCGARVAMPKISPLSGQSDPPSVGWPLSPVLQSTLAASTDPSHDICASGEPSIKMPDFAN